MKSNNFIGLALSVVVGVFIAKLYPSSPKGSDVTSSIIKVVTILIRLGGK